MIKIPYLRNLYEARANQAAGRLQALENWLIHHEPSVGQTHSRLQALHSQLPQILQEAAAQQSSLQLEELKDYPPYQDLLLEIAQADNAYQVSLAQAVTVYTSTHHYPLYICAQCRDSGSDGKTNYCSACFSAVITPYLQDLQLWQPPAVNNRTLSLDDYLKQPQLFLALYQRCNQPDFYRQEQGHYLANLQYLGQLAAKIINEVQAENAACKQAGSQHLQAALQAALTRATTGTFALQETAAPPEVGLAAPVFEFTASKLQNSASASGLAASMAENSAARKSSSNVESIQAATTEQQCKRHLLLTGAVGSGKTFLAAKLAEKILNAGVPAVYVQAQTLAATLQKQEVLAKAFAPDLREQDRIKQYLNLLFAAPLVVIDDLATINLKQSQLLYLFNNFQAGQHLVITTNMSLPQIQQEYGERVLSRILAETQLLTFNTADLRLCIGE